MAGQVVEVQLAWHVMLTRGGIRQRRDNLRGAERARESSTSPQASHTHHPRSAPLARPAP